jgi:iron complex transport system permease protein
MLLALFACLFWALSTGLPDFGPTALGDTLFRILSGSEPEPASRTVFLELRLPRAALAVLAGSGLALAGAGAQAVLSNPLVSPSVLGLSAGASFGAGLVILHGGELYRRAGISLLMGAAFALAMLAVLLTCALAALRRGSRETIILAGIAVSYIFSAGTIFLQYLAPYQDLKSMVFWSVGSLWEATPEACAVLCPLLFGAALLLLRLAPALNALALGEESAAGLGVRVKRLRFATLLLCALLSAGIVSFTGPIGFVGLMSPHLARLLLGEDNRRLLPGAMLLGALLLLGADTAARALFWPEEIPVGIMTSMIGGPFFLFLLLRGKRDGAR